MSKGFFPIYLWIYEKDNIVKDFMLEGMNIPANINNIILGKPYTEDGVGMSGSRIMIFDEYVLKIEKLHKGSAETVKVIQWLEGKIPVPKIIAYETDRENQYTLMSRIKGKMACDTYYLEHPDKMVSLLAEALKMLWSVDVSECPQDRGLEEELIEARYRVENNLVDMDNVEPTTFGENGRFKDPKALLKWLEEHKPDYEPVLSHGDFCLPNVFFKDDCVTGFIDLGDTGVGDKWRDIALCYRSLKHNFDGSFGERVYKDFNPDLLFEKINLKPNREKLEYYILLDELF